MRLTNICRASRKNARAAVWPVCVLMFMLPSYVWGGDYELVWTTIGGGRGLIDKLKP